MRKTLTSSTAILLAALALPAFGVSAFAQTAPAPTPPAATAPATPAAPTASTPAKPATHHRSSARTMTPEQRAARVEAHITKLHKELGITTEQQPKWDAFAQVMRDNATSMTKNFDARGARLASMSAADNMKSFADVAVEHGQEMQRLAVAFQSVYDSMSDSQKKTADALFRAGPTGGHMGAKPAAGTHAKP